MYTVFLVAAVLGGTVFVLQFLLALVGMGAEDLDFVDDLPDDLDLDVDFALKAFLEHGSLTLAEYREIFSASSDESVQTFEALRARLLLEPVSVVTGTLPRSGGRVEEGERYRVPSLLSQVVAGRLKNRYILH